MGRGIARMKEEPASIRLYESHCQKKGEGATRSSSSHSWRGKQNASTRRHAGGSVHENDQLFHPPADPSLERRRTVVMASYSDVDFSTMEST
jgi:hypothetical protein